MRAWLIAILLVPVAGAAHWVDLPAAGVKADVGGGEFLAYILVEGVSGMATEVKAGTPARLDISVAGSDEVDMAFEVKWSATNVEPRNGSGSATFLVDAGEGKGESVDFVPGWPGGEKAGAFHFTVLGREFGGDANESVVEVPLTFTILPPDVPQTRLSPVPVLAIVGVFAAVGTAALALGRKR